MRSLAKHLWSEESGAIAATYALALPALIAAGGIAFDYARMASLDTELQNAADQAALAAVTQLDGKPTACSRAVAAAQVNAAGTSGLLANKTLFANEAAGTLNIQIADPTTCDGVGNIRFYSAYTNAATNTVATTDATAKFVGVTVNTRKAVFALTPIVAAFDSGDLAGTAVAGLGSAICKVPPVMICNPNESADPTFTTANYVGKGLKLASVGGSGGAWAPGNFGYLDVGSSTANPNVELRQALGWINVPGNCSGLGGVKTRTGSGTAVTQALNTRFDIYEKSNAGNPNSNKGSNLNNSNASCPTGGQCPPSINTVKDLLRKGNAGGADKCGFKNNEWELPAQEYLPSANAAIDVPNLPAAQRPTGMGHPRDICHAVSNNGVCGGTASKIGDGIWDRDAYFYVNYGWSPANWKTYVASGVNPIPAPNVTPPSRYRVYQWEIDNRDTSIGGRTILAQRALGNGAAALVDHDKPVCSPLQSFGTGLVPGGSTVDRRRISAAVINCTAQSVNGGGGAVYTVLKWIEFFLVEPSFNRERTDANDVYVEVIGETSLGGSGSTAGQVVRRDKPYLVE
jgi:Flp pilus assembly protein TadG